ncbi:MAG: hypothetical protein ABMB14_16615 [Myxococcota bacterium]
MIPGVFAALYQADPRLTIAGFQAHAQQGIVRLLELLAVRAGSGYVDLDAAFTAVYHQFVPALIAWRRGGLDGVAAIGAALPAGVLAAFTRIDRGEVSAGNLDLLWTEQPMVQAAFYGRHPALAWWMTRGASLDFGLGPNRFPRRWDPRVSLGVEADRVAWDRDLWAAWDQAQGHPASDARIAAIVAAGEAAGDLRGLARCVRADLAVVTGAPLGDEGP